MARPTARVLSLLAILQSGGTHTVGSLARRLEVDERTVRRYVAHLLDLEVPVVSVRGRYGGYRLGPGHRLPPLMLTEEESLAVLLGLHASSRAGWSATSTTAVEAAAAKLGRVLPPRLADRLSALLETSDLGDEATPGAAPEAEALLLIAQAARDRRPVAMAYESREGRRSARTLQPHGIVARSGRWYVTGLDSESGEQRTFRLDRVHLPRLLPGTFDAPEGTDPTAAVLAAIRAAPWRHEVSVRVEAGRDEVRRRFPEALASVEPLDGDDEGWVRVRLRAETLDWLPGLIASLDRRFVVERPDELRDEVLALAGRLTACAGAGRRPGRRT